MVKSHLLTGMVAIMAAAGLSACANPAELNSPQTEKDTRIIVEVDKDLKGLNEEQIIASQKQVLNRIAHRATSNYDGFGSYTVLNNAFTLRVNSADVESIRNVPGVKSVTIDKPHAYKSMSSGSTYSASIKKAPGIIEPNRSAETMLKPAGTEEGAGTIIAILDNEFFFRAKHTETEDCNFHKLNLDGEGHGCDGSMVYHEVYSPLADDVPTKITFEDIVATFKTTPSKPESPYHQQFAYRIDGKGEGEEGSLYFNNKVPFYYDYGGTWFTYGGDPIPDFDVSSLIDYHGSHVSSLAGANAPTYKGIAPDCQLACMKVFTDFKASELDKSIGLGDGLYCFDSNILWALEDAIKLGVDGINMSLGSDLDDFDDQSICKLTLTKLANQGIMSSISAGNAGKTSFNSAGAYANWTTDMVETGILGSYANQVDSTIIGSAQPNYTYYKHAIKIGDANIAYEDQITNREGYDAEYTEELFLKDITTTDFVYIPGFGMASDYENKNVEGKLAIVNRGSTAFSDKYAIAVDKGAVGLIIINNDPTASDFNFRCSFGDGFSPTIPCALVLFKDKQVFEKAEAGTFSFINNEECENDKAFTVSTFSSDGATYNFDLKPEISAPGDIVKGAVPPKDKEHKDTPLTSYEYLSGTSMSSPNHAGAQALMLSKVAGPIYKANPNPTDSQLEEIDTYRRTVDMRLQSTANPMYETDVNPESGEKNYASPRVQGAGMVDLTGALETKVYLEGLDLEGNPINKSKIVLRDSEDISKGDVKLKFIAHNEGAAASYKVKLSVMRPAIKNDNQVATKEYNYRTEISDVQYLPGISFYDEYADMQIDSYGTASFRDVFKLTKDLEFYRSRSDYDEGNKTTMKAGMWYVASSGTDQKRNISYEVLPGYDYQSTQDIVLATVESQVVNVAANGDSEIVIDTYSLTAEQKADIAKYYPYGCAIEGFVELEAQGDYPDLSIPYLGFYAGEGKSYKDAPVVEPFDFEKKSNVIYQSDLANDIAKNLAGKDNAELGSTWAIGYSDNPQTVNISKVLSNEIKLSSLRGFHNIGTDPYSGEYGSNPSDELYVGNPHKSNMMIVSQYVMRSVSENYFTIKNKADGKEVYRSALSDSLYGDQYGHNVLYKSHVDASYLGSYVCHKAVAKIPLFDTNTGIAYPDGDYEITFNYQLAGYNNEWVSKSYTLHVDSTAPEFDDVIETKGKAETDSSTVRFTFKDRAISYGVVGYEISKVQYDSKNGVYYMDFDKQAILSAIKEFGVSSSKCNRIYLKAVDKAYGETGVVVHFSNLDDLNNYEALSYRALAANHDYKKVKGQYVVFEIDERGNETIIDVDANELVSKRKGTGGNPLPESTNPIVDFVTNNLALSIAIGVDVVLTLLLIVFVLIITLRKKPI